MKIQSKSILGCSWHVLMRFAIHYTVFQHATTRSLADGGAEEFSYKVGNPKEPTKWGDVYPEWALCKEGQMQDPIDIPASTATSAPSIGQLVKNYKLATANLTKDHKVKLAKISWVEDAGSILLDGKITYALTNIHWHAPSEHQIDGKRYEVERHTVHITKDKKVPSNIVVIAQLYELGQPDPLLATLMDEITQANAGVQQVQVDSKVFGNDGPQFFRFMGSLTTPPCSENVTWIVDQTIGTMSAEQVQALKKAIKDGGEGNARPLQALNNRPILQGPFAPA